MCCFYEMWKIILLSSLAVFATLLLVCMIILVNYGLGLLKKPIMIYEYESRLDDGRVPEVKEYELPPPQHIDTVL